MAATLISATGSWGIDSDEDGVAGLGLIVSGIEDTSRNEKNFQKNNVGERTGVSLYDESIEVRVSGEMLAASGFDLSLGAAVVMENTISTDHLNTASTGMTLVNEVKRSAGREEWKTLEVDIEVLPFF